MRNKTSKIPMAQEKNNNNPLHKLSDAELFELIQKLELWPAQKQASNAAKQNPKAQHPDTEEELSITSPKALHKFLNSQQGKALKAYLEKIAFMNKKMMDESLHLLIMKDLFKRRLQAHLAFTAKRKRARHNQDLNAAYQEAIDKTEQERRKKLAKSNERKLTVPTYEYNVTTDYDVLIDLLESYKHTRSNLERQLAKEEVLSMAIHKELKEVNAKLQALDEKHAIYTSHFNDLDLHLEHIDRKNIVALEELMQELVQKKEHKNTHIVRLVEQNPFAKVESHLYEQEAIMLQIETLQNAIEVAEGKKAYFDEQGQEVDSHTKAHLVLKRENKVVKQDNTDFLIKAHESLENLGPEAKEQAKVQYLQMKPTLMPKKRAFNEEHFHERGKCIHRIAKLHKASLLSGNRQQETKEQLSKLTTATNLAEAQLSKNITNQQYTNKLQFLRNSGQNEQKTELLNMIKLEPNAKEATKYLHSEFEKLARGAPIPAPTLKRILDTLESFISKAPKPVPTKKNAEEMNPVSAFNPLSMALKPNKY